MKTPALIAGARAWLGLTQAEFGRVAGATRGTVTRWEAGTAPPPAWLLDALAWAPDGAWEPPEAHAPGEEATLARSTILDALRAWEASPKTALHPRYALLRVAVERASRIREGVAAK